MNSIRQGLNRYDAQERQDPFGGGVGLFVDHREGNRESGGWHVGTIHPLLKDPNGRV